MALPILDGNQTAATLSTIITGGAHIPAHTVVSLGSQAISDITSGVSGSVVSISNFPSTQTIAGTVTANTAYATSVTGNAGLTPSVVTAMPVALVDRGVYGGSIMSYDGSNTSLNVNVKGSLPSISGTVTVSNFPETQRIGYLGPGGNTYVAYNQGLPVDIVSIQTNVNPLPISGTVTANVANVVTTDTYFVEQAIKVVGPNGGGIALAGYDSNGNQAIIYEDGGIPVYPRDNKGLNAPFPISGTVTANVFGSGFLDQPYAVPVMTDGGDVVTRGLNIGFHEDLTANEFRTVKASEPFPVQIRKGTVTIGSLPSGALTTRFGSVTTANTAEISSAVTNANRKYLLVQNVTTSSNAITIGVGFVPTTTQGIQLSAGAGITFESSYIPTGAVYILSSVTASPFTILEA